MTNIDIASVVEQMEQITNSLLAIAINGENWLGEVKANKAIKPADIAIALFSLKEAYSKLDETTKRLYHVHNTLDKNVLPERLIEADLDAIRVPEIARSFSLRDNTTASMLDKERGFEWLRSIGQGDLIQETVNAGTLASFCRNMLLEQGVEPPADIIKVNTYKSVSINKYTPKGK